MNVKSGLDHQIHPRSIAAGKTNGKHLTAMFLDTFSDKKHYAPYNWRHKLRITGRRKSESNLDTSYWEHDNSISQIFPLNLSRKRLVESWIRADVERKPEIDTGTTHQMSHNAAQPAPEIGLHLSQTAEKYLGVDLYDNTPVSLFYGHLLDTIEVIRAERDFLVDLLVRPVDLSVKPTKPPSTSIPNTKPDLVPVPELKVLHRVFCTSSSHLSPLGHLHSCGIFEDELVRQFSEICQDFVLEGTTYIKNLDQYCSQIPDISVIVFKESVCVEQFDPRIKERRGLSISPRAERLCVVSGVLQKILDEIALCSEPRSESNSYGKNEMDAPYLFLYHHQSLLIKAEDEATGLKKRNATLLLNFIQSRYDDEYSEANLEFSKGLLTDKHKEKLFHPNEIVIEKRDGNYKAYVVNEWPEITKAKMSIFVLVLAVRWPVFTTSRSIVEHEFAPQGKLHGR